MTHILNQGLGVPEDYFSAAKWYRKAAEQAHMWLNLAASSGDKEISANGAKIRDIVAAKMTPEQVAEAQKLAREWKPKTWAELKAQLPQ